MIMSATLVKVGGVARAAVPVLILARPRLVPRIAWVSTLLGLTLLVACGGVNARSDERSYDVAEQVKTLVIDARAAAVTVEAGDGPIRVTETYHYTEDKPRTSHQVSGTALKLTETGCGNADVRCAVEFKVRVPAATAVEITTNAGAVSLSNLTGNVTVATDAGAVEGKGLGSDNVSVKTDAGATSLQFAEPPATVEASTDLGAILVKVPSGTSYAVDVSTAAGGSHIEVQQDPSSRYKLSLRTSVGAIRVENA
jgi:DUF4097 and DUF4098 domain-containing protein YvlB